MGIVIICLMLAIPLGMVYGFYHFNKIQNEILNYIKGDIEKWKRMLQKEFLNVLVVIQKWQHTRSQAEEQATDILSICFVMYARKSKALYRLTIIS